MASIFKYFVPCLLYTSDAADDLLCVDLGGRRIIKKKESNLMVLKLRFEKFSRISATTTVRRDVRDRAVYPHSSTRAADWWFLVHFEGI